MMLHHVFQIIIKLQIGEYKIDYLFLADGNTKTHNEHKNTPTFINMCMYTLSFNCCIIKLTNKLCMSKYIKE